MKENDWANEKTYNLVKERLAKWEQWKIDYWNDLIERANSYIEDD